MTTVPGTSATISAVIVCSSSSSPASSSSITTPRVTGPGRTASQDTSAEATTRS